MKTCFQSYKVAYVPPSFSYDHLASVIRKVLEEKPENLAGKFLICTIYFNATIQWDVVFWLSGWRLLTLSIFVNIDVIEDTVRDEKRAKFCPNFDTIQVGLLHYYKSLHFIIFVLLFLQVVFTCNFSLATILWYTTTWRRYPYTCIAECAV